MSIKTIVLHLFLTTFLMSFSIHSNSSPRPINTSRWLEFNDARLIDVIKELDLYYDGDLRLHGGFEKRVTARLNTGQIEKALKVLAKSMKMEMEISTKGNIHFFDRNWTWEQDCRVCQ